jgi:hypothetical protein
VAYTLRPLEERHFPYAEYILLYNSSVIRRLIDLRVITLVADVAVLVPPHVTTHEDNGADALIHQAISGAGTYTHAQIDTELGGLIDAGVLYDLVLAESVPGAFKHLLYTGTELTSALLYTGPYVAATPARSLSFVAGSPACVTCSSGSFLTDGFVDGNALGVRGTTANDGVYLIASVTATQLTMDAGVVFASEGPYTSGVSVHNLLTLLYTKELTYVGGYLTAIKVTRESDSAYVWKYLTYSSGGDLNQISLQE